LSREGRSSSFVFESLLGEFHRPVLHPPTSRAIAGSQSSPREAPHPDYRRRRRRGSVNCRAPGRRRRHHRAGALEAAAAAIGGDAFAVPLDLAEPASIAATVAAAEAKLGPVDGLVNCAAIVIHADPLETAWTDWERIFRINLFGAYEISRLVARSMIDSGARGAIVSVASEAGKKGHVESLAYSASKAALINMTRVLSAALAPHDINVNCICPGGVATDMLREVAVAYGKLAGQAAGDVFPQLVSSQLARHIEPDLLPPERRRPYHPGTGRQRGRRRHAILRRLRK
jgi:NAD(P)-dependent dehydrogenase (short-subunit alcohol dehydrogenase family)